MLAGRTLLRALLFGAMALVVLVPGRAALAEPTVDQQIDDATNQLELVVEAYNKITEDLASTQQQIADLSKRLEPLQADVDRTAASVDQFAIAAYMRSGGMRNASLLLSAGSADTFVDQLSTLEQLSKAQQHDITTYRDAKSAFDTEKLRLDQLLAEQNAQKTELEAKKTKIEGDIKKLEALKKRSTTKPTAPVNAGPPPAVSGSAGAVVNFAYAQLGKPYKWAAAGPGSFDCSGLTMRAWGAAGVSLPHNAAQQWNKVRHISRSVLAPGDLVFYNGLGHVGIYVGNGNIIHAPHTGDVVRIAPVDQSKPYGYGRPG